MAVAIGLDSKHRSALNPSAVYREAAGDGDEEECNGPAVGLFCELVSRLYQRPTPEELKEILPGVYESLSEEARANEQGREATALFKVYASLLMATAEQMMIVEKVRKGGDC